MTVESCDTCHAQIDYAEQPSAKCSVCKTFVCYNTDCFLKHAQTKKCQGCLLTLLNPKWTFNLKEHKEQL